jgi:hypothetical protein
MTTTKRQDAINSLAELFQQYGLAPLTEGELNDYNISGDETYQELKQIDSDLANEYSSYLAQNKSRYNS